MTPSSTTLTVRLDDEVAAMLDELFAFYGKQASELGVSFSRSDAIRVSLRAAHRDMQEKMREDA